MAMTQAEVEFEDLQEMMNRIWGVLEHYRGTGDRPGAERLVMASGKGTPRRV
jgi:hypothetical protein